MARQKKAVLEKKSVFAGSGKRISTVRMISFFSDIHFSLR